VADPIRVVARRGDTVESEHVVHAVAVRDGRVIEQAGDPSLVTFLRSSAKPFQALPLAREERDLPDEELAIACASHDGLPEHLAAVEALLARAEATADNLECGLDAESKLRHNCSGKHAGMLLHARDRGWPREGYRLAGHPVQAEGLVLIAEATGVPAGDIPTGVDGCGVVTFAVSLEAMARAFARLVADELDGAGRVVHAMRDNPMLIGGPKAADTALMHALPGAIAKRGAEGLMCLGLPDGTGVAVKVVDGANRAAGPAAGLFLGLGDSLADPVINSRGEEVGWVFPTPEN
jgi:L-asparaginase II